MTGRDKAGPPVAATSPNEPEARIEPMEPTPPAVPTGASSAGSKRWPLRAALAIAVAVLAMIGSWFLLRTGVQVDTWPSFLPDAGSTSITPSSAAISRFVSPSWKRTLPSITHQRSV
jgi:hypothetical protein